MFRPSSDVRLRPVSDPLTRSSWALSEPSQSEGTRVWVRRVGLRLVRPVGRLLHGSLPGLKGQTPRTQGWGRGKDTGHRCISVYSFVIPSRRHMAGTRLGPCRTTPSAVPRTGPSHLQVAPVTISSTRSYTNTSTSTAIVVVFSTTSLETLPERVLPLRTVRPLSVLQRPTHPGSSDTGRCLRWGIRHPPRPPATDGLSRSPPVYSGRVRDNQGRGSVRAELRLLPRKEGRMT